MTSTNVAACLHWHDLSDAPHLRPRLSPAMIQGALHFDAHPSGPGAHGPARAESAPTSKPRPAAWAIRATRAAGAGRPPGRPARCAPMSLARRADHAFVVRSARSRAADHERAVALSAQVRDPVLNWSGEHGQQVRVVQGAAHIEFARHSRCTRTVGRQDAGVTWRAIRVPVMPARVRPVSPGAVRGCGGRGAVNLAAGRAARGLLGHGAPGRPVFGCWISQAVKGAWREADVCAAEGRGPCGDGLRAGCRVHGGWRAGPGSFAGGGAVRVCHW